MRALVTGGAGFIGSNLVDALLREGHSVWVLDNLTRGRRDRVNPASHFVDVDISSTTLLDAVAAAQPDIVFHQAAQIDVRHSVADPVADAETNVVGTVNLLNACAHHAVRRLVFASSGGAVYGDTSSIPTAEAHPTQPSSPYGASKLCGEAYGGLFQRMRRLDVIALRYANVYGPRQEPDGEAGVVAIFAQRLLRGEPVTINGDGQQTRDYVYVDDVVAANLRAIDAAAPDVFNVGTGVETTVNEIHSRLCRIIDVLAAPLHGPARPGEQARSCLSIAHARDVLDWQPSTGLDEGLRRTVDFFRDA